jgi:hypothetical protein
VAGLFEALDHEWSRLSRDRAAARELDTVCRVAGGAVALGDVERYVRAAGPEAGDRVLLALVRLAVAGSSLAARVLLQLLLPGTRRLARQWWALGDADERAAAAVTAVYQRICCYPVDRRPGRVAANILLDAARELRGAVPRVVLAPTPDPWGQLRGHGRAPGPAQPAPHPALELVEVLVEAVQDQVIDAADARLIARSRIGGDRIADLASHRGSRPRTLWDRRQRAEHALVSAHAARAGAHAARGGTGAERAAS